MAEPYRYPGLDEFDERASLIQRRAKQVETDRRSAYQGLEDWARRFKLDVHASQLMLSLLLMPSHIHEHSSETVADLDTLKPSQRALEYRQLEELVWSCSIRARRIEDEWVYLLDELRRWEAKNGVYFTNSVRSRPRHFGSLGALCDLYIEGCYLTGMGCREEPDGDWLETCTYKCPPDTPMRPAPPSPF